jgi:hypothetical protein
MKIKDNNKSPYVDTIKVKTKTTNNRDPQAYHWWKADSDQELSDQILATVAFLKERNNEKYRKASIHARLYGGMPLSNYFGNSSFKDLGSRNMPIDRPTMSVVTSLVDTIVSRISQEKPRPVFLTDNGDYKERRMGQQINQFISGEFYQVKAYKKTTLQLRDAAVLGTGILKVFEKDNKMCVERKLFTDILVDDNDAFYGSPRQFFELKLVDRSVYAEMFPKAKKEISNAEQAYIDAGADSEKTASDQIIVAEAFHLPSGKDAKDGRHSIVCSEGVIFDEEYKKDRPPYVFLNYANRITGLWGVGVPERQMGKQVEINKLLMTSSKAINLVGVPRVFLEAGSKVVKSQINDEIGSIITYTGTKPTYEVAPCMPAEVYQEIQNWIQRAYEEEGISQMTASGKKPAGLNSGVAQREYDDIQSDRFATLSTAFNDAHNELAYLLLEGAIDIAKREGSYQTVYPNKNGVKEIPLPDFDPALDPFVIQCYDASSLPRDPAGRLEKITEMIQAGMLSIEEGRRLLDYPDLEQNEKLANAGEERILKILDKIVEDGKYTPPDPFMDPNLATKLVTQYYNLYVGAKLEENRAQMLRTFYDQLNDLKQAAIPPAPQPGQQPPQAVPQPLPQSPLLPRSA